MKKALIVGGVVIGAAVLVGPKLVASVAKDSYMDFFEQIPANASFTVDPGSYEDSWFSSNAVAAVNLHSGNPELDQLSIILKTKIQHGPVMLTDKGLKVGLSYTSTRVAIEGLPAEAKAFIDEHFDGIPVSSSSLIGFNKQVTSDLTVSEFKVNENDNEFFFGGLTVTGESDTAMTQVNGDIAVQAITLTDPSMQITVAESSGAYDYKKFSDAIMLGNSEFMLPSIEATTPMGNIQIDNLGLTAAMTETDGKINLAERVFVEKMAGPMPLTAASYEFDVNKIDPKAIEMWTDFIQKLQQSNNPDEMQPNDAELREFVSVFLQKGLEFNQLLTVEGLGGKMTTDIDVRYVGFDNGQHPMDVQDEALILSSVEADIVIEADEAAILQTPAAMMLDTYIQQGFVVRKDGKLIINAHLKKGELRVNEQIIPAEQVLQMAGLGNAEQAVAAEPQTDTPAQ